MEEIKFVYAVYMLYLFISIASVAALFLGVSYLLKFFIIKNTIMTIEKVLTIFVLISVSVYALTKISPLIKDVAAYMKFLAN